MHAESSVLDLVGLVYEAAGDRSLWPVFLTQAGRLFGSQANTIHVQNVRTPSGNDIVSIGIEPAYRRSYEAYFGQCNVYYTRGRTILKPGSICTTEDLCPPNQAHKSEFYNDWMRPQRHAYALNAVLFRREDFVSLLGLIRFHGRPPFTEEDFTTLRALVPHLQRAVQLHQRITDLETKTSAAQHALDRWSLGVILLDAKGSVILINRAAEAILNQRDGLALDRDGLHASLAQDTTALKTLIHGAIVSKNCQATPKRSKTQPGGTLHPARPSGKRPLNVLVTPVCPNNRLFPLGGAAAALFVSDPDAQEEPEGELLGRIYGLTPAEARVAVGLITGKTLPAIADGLGITLNTAKTHAKRIFAKSGTKGQADFVRVVLLGPAALKGMTKHHPMG